MTLLAGAAVREITPEGDVALYGYPRVERRSTGVHDPLRASAIYLETEACGGVLLASLDLLFLDTPTARRIQRSVADRLGLPETRVFISCTHTHSGPVTTRLLSWRDDPTLPDPDPAYLDFVERRTLETAAAARKNVRPAESAWTSADARGVGGNRRDPAGVTDPECGVLAVRTRGDAGSEASFLAVSMIYGMHPTVLHEDSTLISADFPHFAREFVRASLPGRPVVSYHTGPCGDQSPRHFVEAQTFEEARRLGRLLGESVWDAVRRIPADAWASEPILAASVERLDLPRRRIPSPEDAEGILESVRRDYERLRRSGSSRAEVRTAECAVFGAESAATLARAQAQGAVSEVLDTILPAGVQVLRIGDTCLAGLPGEIFAAYGLDIRTHVPCRTFVATLVNGELQGYIVTPEAAAEGGYEAANSLLAPEAGDRLAASAIRQIVNLVGSGREGAKG